MFKILFLVIYFDVIKVKNVQTSYSYQTMNTSDFWGLLWSSYTLYFHSSFPPDPFVVQCTDDLFPLGNPVTVLCWISTHSVQSFSWCYRAWSMPASHSLCEAVHSYESIANMFLHKLWLNVYIYSRHTL